ncbi:cysteine hydrolase family protein [Deinococcus sp. UYEF24]
MPVTQLDPRSALIAVDLQQGLLAGPAGSPVHGVVRHARMLVDAFHAHDLPVVLVEVDGLAPGRSDLSARSGPGRAWTDLLPELGRQPQDHVVTKQTWGSFTRTGLEAHLKSLGVTQVVLAGVATGLGVESTARQAYDLGFNVTLATDAAMDRSPEAHEYSVTQIFPLIAETGTTAEILALLNGRNT